MRVFKKSLLDEVAFSFLPPPRLTVPAVLAMWAAQACLHRYCPARYSQAWDQSLVMNRNLLPVT
ncbi:MAG: hypothetical protein LBM60_05925 [Clostridium sp.]|nr:hypothetical protein [Clostridium sp.]